ncbi:hypothetical protein [Enterococcus pallens]|uniref:Uncharacterized protein n=1 Tax=Enterococcus pallens ATCC BAA-351 TaxID=1158607 RepID=R2SLI1_9ENTE|nr:hypothetical protein [Enterococcus pallens]EOH93731.1 hypothetical protein UAU_02427 [Enterococcus pallens ATCC BAA-351]EOU24571.1 hypothetical protein I588_00558 [Enterococcus pallens ATCC BAA-351]
MTYIERKKYVIYSSTAFLTGFVLYGILGLFIFFNPDLIEQWTFLQRSLMLMGIGIVGGYLISSLLSGILLFSHYTQKKSTRFKVVMIVLFMITVQVIAIVGFVLNLPMYIVNLLHVLRRRQIIEK